MASDKEKKEDGLTETVKTVVYALLIAGVFRSFFFQPFWIPTGSMKDTLLVGDFLFVNKMAYGYSSFSCPFGICPFGEGRLMGSEPERGDIVVFRHPVNGQDYIKRLIGLPGDKVQLRDGVLFLNGDAQKQEPNGVFEEIYEAQGSVGGFPSCKGAVGTGSVCEKDSYFETLEGGTVHKILNIRNAPGTNSPDNTPIFTVPEGEYFFMGDNRDNSIDSRFPQQAGGVGFVPYKNLLGKASRVVFSSAGGRMLYFWTWRGDRFFKKVD